MPHINSPPWPTGTTVELYPAAGIAGNGEPATAPIATAVMAWPGTRRRTR
jgi:hypothetical protein